MNVAMVMAKLSGVRKALDAVLTENVSRNRSQGEVLLRRSYVLFLVATCRAAILGAVIKGNMQAAIGEPIQMGHDENRKVRCVLLTLGPAGQPLLNGDE
ncbi:hypothetical protein [Ralstonia mannitolilytica]|uniref:hypothetical protein n=1 Tax=Ralstonia mannitolilytica TaxID=105219 RepID=UPI003B83F3AC